MPAMDPEEIFACDRALDPGGGEGARYGEEDAKIVYGSRGANEPTVAQVPPKKRTLNNARSTRARSANRGANIRLPPQPPSLAGTSRPSGVILSQPRLAWPPNLMNSGRRPSSPLPAVNAHNIPPASSEGTRLQAD
jgi:hypothetical protein